MITSANLSHSTLCHSYREGFFTPQITQEKQILGIASKEITLFLKQPNLPVKSIKIIDVNDLITDVVVLPRNQGDVICVGCFEKGKIEFHQFDQYTSKFEIRNFIDVSNQKYSGKVFLCNFRVKQLNGNTLFGFSKIGRIMIWDVKDVSSPRSIDTHAKVMLPEDYDKLIRKTMQGEDESVINDQSKGIISRLFGFFKRSSPEAIPNTPSKEKEFNLDLDGAFEMIEEVWLTEFFPNSEEVSFVVLQRFKKFNLVCFSYNIANRKISSLKYYLVDRIFGVEDSIQIEKGNLKILNVFHQKTQETSSNMFNDLIAVLVFLLSSNKVITFPQNVEIDESQIAIAQSKKDRLEEFVELGNECVISIG